MSLYGAIQDVPLARGGSRRGMGIYLNVGALAAGAVAFTVPFKTITGALATILNAAAPGLSTSTLTYSVAGNVVTIKGWMPTSAANPTLIATTGTDTISVLVFGKYN